MAPSYFEDQELAVSQYEISGDSGDHDALCTVGPNYVGLSAGDDEESMFVYRADYFENGFEAGN